MLTPKMIITPVITAATPAAPVRMLPKSALDKMANPTGAPKIYGVPKLPTVRENVNSTDDINAGSMSGMTTFRMIDHREAPNMRADSSNCVSNDRSAPPNKRNTSGNRWNAIHNMIGNIPYASQSGGRKPKDSAIPATPAIRRFLKIVIHASANVQEGRM